MSKTVVIDLLAGLAAASPFALLLMVETVWLKAIGCKLLFPMWMVVIELAVTLAAAFVVVKYGKRIKASIA